METVAAILGNVSRESLGSFLVGFAFVAVLLMVLAAHKRMRLWKIRRSIANDPLADVAALREIEAELCEPRKPVDWRRATLSLSFFVGVMVLPAVLTTFKLSHAWGLLIGAAVLLGWLVHHFRQKQRELAGQEPQTSFADPSATDPFIGFLGEFGVTLVALTLLAVALAALLP